MKKAINEAAQSITFTFDGELAPVTLAMKDVSPANATYAMLHGFAARIGDNAAISRKQKDGTIITVTEAMRREAIIELVNHYTSGSPEWNLKTSSAKSINPVWLALAEKRGVSYDVVAAEKAAADIAELESL